MAAEYPKGHTNVCIDLGFDCCSDQYVHQHYMSCGIRGYIRGSSAMDGTKMIKVGEGGSEKGEGYVLFLFAGGTAFLSVFQPSLVRFIICHVCHKYMVLRYQGRRCCSFFLSPREGPLNIFDNTGELNIKFSSLPTPVISVQSLIHCGFNIQLNALIKHHSKSQIKILFLGKLFNFMHFMLK